MKGKTDCSPVDGRASIREHLPLCTKARGCCPPRSAVNPDDRVVAQAGTAHNPGVNIIPTKSHRAHRVLRQVVAQFQLGILQEARELPPERECVVRRLAQGAGRQGSVAGCLDLHADYLQQWLGPLQTQRMARGVVEVLFARQGVEPEQLVDPRHDARGDHVARMELGRLEKLPSRMRPASGMHDPRSADAIIGAITVGLQNAFELPQKLLWPVAPPPQTEVEHYAASRPAVLPQIRLMVLPPPIVHLHIYRRLISLNVTAAD